MSNVPVSFEGDLGAVIKRWTTESPLLTPRPEWRIALERFGTALGGSELLVRRFVAAWSWFYSATLLVDHLQDGDELGDSDLAAQPAPLQYHLALSTYALSNREITELATELPSARGLGLNRFWSQMVFQLAEGQYRDLTLPAGHLLASSQALDVYEEVAAQKTGAAFALALGGCAWVSVADLARVDAATSIGFLIGTLLQYQDDLLDQVAQDGQQNTLTLARALAAQLNIPANELPLPALWSLVYSHYRAGLDTLLAAFPASAACVISELVDEMFGAVPLLTTAPAGGPLSSPEPA